MTDFIPYHRSGATFSDGHGIARNGCGSAVTINGCAPREAL
jgi:hypothetical protein